MPLETGDYIADLNPNNPLGTDFLSQGAGHDRLTKKCTQQSFPNINGEVSCTPADLNQLSGTAVGGGAVPVTGMVTMYAGATAPNGYLLCNGAAIDGQYTALIALVGANTPNLMGQFIRGWSINADVDPDGPRAALSTQAQAVGPHTHTYTRVLPFSTFAGSGAPYNCMTIANPTDQAQTADGGGTDNRPVNVAMTFIIKT